MEIRRETMSMTSVLASTAQMPGNSMPSTKSRRLVMASSMVERGMRLPGRGFTVRWKRRAMPTP